MLSDKGLEELAPGLEDLQELHELRLGGEGCKGRPMGCKRCGSSRR